MAKLGTEALAMATIAQKTKQPLPGIPDITTNGDQPMVNRKKQKRREKQAAKLAATQTHATLTSKSSHRINGTSHVKSVTSAVTTVSYQHVNGSRANHPEDDDELFYTDDELEYEQAVTAQSSGKSKRKKKRSQNHTVTSQYSSFHVPGAFQPPPPPPPPPLSASDVTTTKPARNSNKHSIWNTSTAEERERIKEFWISLDEAERRSLVKVEKEAVLKKMKEQQKHSCSCSVCGRKRNAIEEELEVLYDAYYEELEQYANHRQLGIGSGHPMLPPPASYSSMNKIPLQQNHKTNHTHAHSQRMAGTFEDEELDEDEYSEDDEDDEEGDDAEYEEDSYTSEATHHPIASDIFMLGKSLMAQGGILTVADDLLKNDGRKFIEMMEQLAERRMQREEEAQYAARGLSHPLSASHNHPPLDDDEYDDEDDDDEYASDDEDDYDDDEEMEGMSEEQRMEEGRRMFQIFAARMFEQRVLIAYREKVARERQEKLLEELADESRLDEQREAKKVRDAIKKKEKKNKQKVVKEEEKLKREAEKAEQEATERLAEEKKLEEQRARKEAQRKKRETEKQAQEAERQKKESDRLRKLQEAKDQQAEQERKQRENKEREKRRKDEAKKKEHDEKEAREREQRDRDILAKSETNAKEAQEREIRERSRRQDTVRSIGHTTPVPIPLARKASSNAAMSSGLNSMATSAPSPHLQIATPSIPKAPTPNRARQASRQGSIQSSPKSTTQPASSTATSPSSTNIPPPLSIAQPVIKQIQPQAVMNNSIPMAPPPGMNHSLGAMSPPPGLNSPAFTPGFGPIYTNGLHPRGPVGHDIGAFSQQQPINSPMYRGFINTPSIVGFPPGINAVPRQTVPCRVPPGEIPVTQTPIGTGVTPGLAQPTSHSRNASASFDIPAQIQPIGRPAANMRMSMCTTRPDVLKHEADDLSKHLGSSALLDDTEDTLEPTMDRPHLGTGGHRPSRLGFGGPQIFPEAINSAKNDAFPRSGWGAPPIGFGTPTMSNTQHWPATPANHWSSNAFGNVNGPSRQPRALTLRHLICQACKALSNQSFEGTNGGFGYHSVDLIMHHIEHNRPPNEPIPPVQEILDICETEGNQQNGGGSLSLQDERGRGVCVKWIPDGSAAARPSAGAPGEIGSPVVGSSHLFGISRPFPGVTNNGF